MTARRIFLNQSFSKAFNFKNEYGMYAWFRPLWHRLVSPCKWQRRWRGNIRSMLTMRGTAGLDISLMCLAYKPMKRGDHLRNYDIAPMSQNPIRMYYTVRASIWKDNHIRGATDYGVVGGQVTAWRPLIKAAVFAAFICGAGSRGAKSFADEHSLLKKYVLGHDRC